MPNSSTLNLVHHTLRQLIKQFIYKSNSSLVENSTFLGLFLITCHIFEKYSLNIFLDYNLDKISEKLLKQATKQNYAFLNLSANQVLGLVDIWYVAEQRNIKTFNINLITSCFEKHPHSLYDGELMYSWLIKEMIYLVKAKTTKIDKRYRPYKNKNKIYDLYWITHLIFLETNYFKKTLDYKSFSLEILELLGACDFLVCTKNMDLAAEVAICLDLAEKSNTKEYNSIIKKHLDNANQLLNHSSIEFDISHTSSVVMVAIAGFIKNLTKNYPNDDKKFDRISM